MRQGLFFLSLAAFIIISCSKDNYVLETKEGKEGVPVFVFPEGNKSPIKEIRDDGTIIIRDKGIQNQIQDGSIICSDSMENAPYGFFYKVKSTRSEGDCILVETIPAALEEAIKEGSANGSVSISEYFEGIEYENGEYLDYKSLSSTKTDFSKGIKLPISISHKEGDLEYALTGELCVDGLLHYDMEFADWSIQKFEFWYQCDMSSKLDMSTKVKYKGQLIHKSIGYITLRPIRFVIFGIPVIIKPTIHLFFDVTVNGSVKIGCELVSYKTQYKAGIQYYKKTGWESIADCNYDSKDFSFLDKCDYLEMEGSFQIGVESRAIPAFYGYIPKKNRADISVSVPIKVSISDIDAVDILNGYVNPQLSISTGATISAKAYLSILSRKIADFEPKLKLFEWVFYKKHLYPSFSSMDVLENTPDRTSIMFSMENLDDCIFTDLSDYGIYYRQGSWTHNQKEGFEQQVSLGSVDLSTIGIGEPNRHFDFTVDLSGLLPGETYSVRPYSTDSFLNSEHIARVSSFTAAEKNREQELRDKLIQFYKDTGGEHWYHQYNWCSEEPLDTWYGISVDDNGFISLDLSNNNLSHGGSLSDCDDIVYINVGSMHYMDSSFEYLDVSGCSNLVYLYCMGCKMKNLSIEGCSNLEVLYAEGEDTEYINISSLEGCKELKQITIVGDLIETIDLSNFPVLEYLDLTNNALKQIDVTRCPELEYIDVSSNKLTNLNLSGLSKLRILSCYCNTINQLTISGNSLLTALDCSSNKLTELDVSACKESIESLCCNDNLYTNLDLSGCIKLRSLDIDGPELKTLDLSGIPLAIINSRGASEGKCPKLETLICANCPNMEHSPFESFYGLSDLRSLKYMDISNSPKINDRIYADDTRWPNLEYVDISGCSSIIYFQCKNGVLNHLNVSGCSALAGIDCQVNSLTSLDVSGLESLTQLSCSGNRISSLNVSGCISLEYLMCHANELTSVDVSGLSRLESLGCSQNQITNINYSGCTSLRGIDCSDNLLTYIDISGLPSIKYLTCQHNHIIQQINNEDRILTGDFVYDHRYKYYDEIDETTGVRTTKWSENQYGWYYPGEPEKLYHGR